MNLILSDRHFNIPEIYDPSIEYIDLSQLRIASCTGCFGCWTKTPGKCVIRDDAVDVYPKIAASSRVLYISRIKYGGYDTVMKTMLERAIPIQQAFIRLFRRETHHIQRNVVPKQATIIGYGDISNEEQSVFHQLVERNARNMLFDHWRVVFAAEENLEQVVSKEVSTWKKS